MRPLAIGGKMEPIPLFLLISGAKMKKRGTEGQIFLVCPNRSRSLNDFDISL